MIRSFYAEEVRAVANLQNEALAEAFARVRREDYLGAGPWQIATPDSWQGMTQGSAACEGYRTTPDADPRHLYHNVLVAIDAARRLNNGQPASLAVWLDASRSLGASNWAIFRMVRLPNALPFIFAGLNVAIVLAILGSIVGEFIGSKAGLGNLILTYTQRFDTAHVLAAVLAITLLATLLMAVGRAIENYFARWKAGV